MDPGTVKIVMAFIGLMVVLANALVIGFRVVDKRTINKNGGLDTQKMAALFNEYHVQMPEPGKADECLKRGKSITILETEMPYVKKAIDDTKKNVGKLHDKVDGNLTTILSAIKKNNK